MILLSSIINAFESAFLAQYQRQVLPSHRKVLAAMKVCRTKQSPKMLAGCSQCDHQTYIPHSCGHRNCPHCQSHEGQQWLERQLKKQVPAEYFLITFTLPAEFRFLARHHQRKVYALMMQCSWDTVQTFSKNDQRLQGKPGGISVLHTHSRHLGYHPHVHMIIPAAAIDTKKRLWRTKKSSHKDKSRYLFCHKALAKVFRAKMLNAIAKEGLTLPSKYPAKWVVDCKSVGSGEKALIYLGRYLYRGVIQEKDIVSCHNGKVTYRFKNSNTGGMEYRTVTGAKFLWLVIQHVLPKGFRRTRNYGYLHPNSKRLIQLLHLILNVNPLRALGWVRERPKLVCRCCGASMKIVKTRIPPTLNCKTKEGVTPLDM